MARQRLRGVVLLSALVGVTQLALARPAPSEGLNCNEPSNSAAEAICADKDTQHALSGLQAAYTQLLKTGTARRQEKWRVYEQRWEASLAKDYAAAVVDHRTRRELHDLLMRALSYRASRLRALAERERITYVDRSPIVRSACTAVLDKANMSWDGRDSVGDRGFEIHTAYEVNGWKYFDGSGMFVEKTLDFLNDGHKQKVYMLDIENSNFAYTWYVLPLSSEDSRIQNELPDTATLAKDLTKPSYIPVRGDPFPSADPTTVKQPSPLFKSRLLDTSATNLYGGSYTTSVVLQYKHTTYVLATAVRNSGGPTFALFKPEAPGALKPVCYYRATPSRIVRKVKQIDPHLACPAGQQGLPTGLETCDKATAAITLPDWGGTRLVTEDNEYVTPYECDSESVAVGNIGAHTVTKNAWPPLDHQPRDKSPYFMLTRDGGFFVFADPQTGAADYSGSTREFEKVDHDRLVPVCEQTDSVVDPPGYRKARY